MFAVAYVLLPFSDVAPADAIAASLAPFQRGGPGDVPDDWLAFHDETDTLRTAHEVRWTFTDDGNGLRIDGGHDALFYLDSRKITDEMTRRGLHRWTVRFADHMSLDAFFDRFSHTVVRHSTGRYGLWINPLGRWDWWDLGGRMDGLIIGDRQRGRRSTATISSGDNPGRRILTNIETVFGAALGQAPPAEVDVLTNRNIELVATLLAELNDGQPHACPGAIVLPPGAVADSMRWLRKWPKLDPVEAVTWLGLPLDASWEAVAETAFSRFHDHWAAGVAYHL